MDKCNKRKAFDVNQTGGNKKIFPRLYDIALNKKLKIWEISVYKKDKIAEIKSIYGYENGKMQEFIKQVKLGKNIGRKNETTPYEQAILEAKSKWNKKIKEGMKTNKKELTKRENIKKRHRDIHPMLAVDYNKRNRDIKFPCFVQPKLDGVRCIAQNDFLTSRNVKEFVGLFHIKKELLNNKYIFDGELYSDKLDFQTLTGLINTKKNIDKEKMEKINYIVYDIVLNEDYDKRLKTLIEIFNKNKFKYIKLHKTEECNSRNEIENFHEKYIKDGYEGLIIRNKKGEYKEKYRSKNLQKYKKFQDSEFEIINFTDGIGREKGLIIWICKTKNNKTFQVRPKGTYNERRMLYKDGKKYIGKLLTVVYQELTKNGIPRFPTTRYGGKGDIRIYE